MFKKILVYINIWRTLPAYLFYKTNKMKVKCKKDLEQWGIKSDSVSNKSEFIKFSHFMVNDKGCRTIFLNRLHRNPIMFVITRCLFKPMVNCFLNMPPEAIGGGFYLQHAFSTIVAAKSIGENCTIFQQVTVGYNGDKAPVIGNNVEIMAGALVIGGVTLGDNCKVGAGAVVVNDVPANATVVGCPAKVIKISE